MLVLGLVAVGRAADSAAVVNVWPGKAPGAIPDKGPEEMTGAKGSRHVTNVSQPTLTVFRPAKDKNTGAAILIAPGGGYNYLSWDHEGEDVATWLNSLGVTGILLKYRVPRLADHPKYPLQDAQRAISIVRSKAKEWDLDPAKVGMLGFSAGGHLTAVAETNYDKRAYDPIDDTDKVSCRPDFAVVVYPGGVIARGTGHLVPDVRVTKDTPPTFLMQASDDSVGVENSVQLYLALKRAGVSAELHVFATGGHGYGMRPGKTPTADWPKRCEDWMRARGILNKPAVGP